jgi:hypothetical protein
MTRPRSAPKFDSPDERPRPSSDVAGSPSDDVNTLVRLFKVQPFLRVLVRNPAYAPPPEARCGKNADRLSTFDTVAVSLRSVLGLGSRHLCPGPMRDGFDFLPMMSSLGATTIAQKRPSADADVGPTPCRERHQQNLGTSSRARGLQRRRRPRVRLGPASRAQFRSPAEIQSRLSTP